jgi:hypothetical protein
MHHSKNPIVVLPQLSNFLVFPIQIKFPGPAAVRIIHLLPLTSVDNYIEIEIEIEIEIVKLVSTLNMPI